MLSSPLKAPFPYFGGKSRCAERVWAALGDVQNYVEPFAGSLAVLLARPNPHPVETVNDIDHYIANFWRALQHDPQAVAHYANNPENEADLTARHIWLVNQGRDRIERILGDPDYYDAQVAGWWVWGICCWIGSGWCSGKGSWTSENGKIVKRPTGKGADRQLIHLGNGGQGVNRKLIHLGNGGQGVKRQLIHLGNGGRGVNRGLIHSDSAGLGVNRKSLHQNTTSRGMSTGEEEILAYLNELAERLRYVRVCCGDWSRVVTRGALDFGRSVGIFLDPPYDTSLRDNRIYNTDKEYGSISSKVRQWCIENQDNPRYRIVLAGYENEHELLPGWRKVEWVAGRAYGARSDNRRLERLWLSPNCLGDLQSGFSTNI